MRFRAHVDEEIERLLESDPEPEAVKRIELGANHEEQHQELLLTDVLHAFFTNPLRPAYAGQGTGNREQGTEKQGTGNREQGTEKQDRGSEHLDPVRFLRFEGGMSGGGARGDGFCFDNELPRHRVWLEPYGLAERLVTCGEYAEFMEDGGYRRPELWLSDGWNAMQTQGWRSPLYWTSESGEWAVFTLRGLQPMKRMKNAPVSQVSFYEADAYARWAGYRLPTEFEWEAAAEGLLIAGNLLDEGWLMPIAASESAEAAPLTRGEGDGAAEGEPGRIPAAVAAIWRLLAMDGERVPGLPGVPAAGRIAGRIQRQVHERADGSARRIVRDSEGAYPVQLSELFSAGNTLAIFRDQNGILVTPNRQGSIKTLW